MSFPRYRYVGTVVRASGGNVRVKFDDETTDAIPREEVEKLASPISDNPEAHYPERFYVGDIVDAKFQDKSRWYRGRIATVNEDGSACDIMYYDSGDVSDLMFLFTAAR